MPDSDGGKFSKIGLIWAIIPATLVCAVFIGAGLLQATEYGRQADKQIADYAKYTESKKTHGCIHSIRADKIACLNAASDAYRENRYNQRDLVAQKTSALWAFIMGAAAVVGMALSAVGVWLVKTTFDETRKANSIANRAANEAAHHMNASKNAAVLSDRAMVSVVSCILRPPPLETTDGFMVGITLQNNGKSPARILRADFYISDKPSFRRNSVRHKRMNILLAPERTMETSPSKVRAPKDYPRYLSGLITYATIYDAEFVSFFCFKVHVGLQRDILGDLQPLELDPISYPTMPADT